MIRPGVRLQTSSSSSMEESQLEEACPVFRDWLAGLALREPVRAGDGAVARHAQVCIPCDAFADDLAASARWLLESGQRRYAAEPNLRELDWALLVQLRARLARDLLTRSRGESSREAELVEDDLCRLSLIASRLGQPSQQVTRVRQALEDPRAPRARLLGLATRLDPIGLDIALAWIGWLLHAGRRERADRYADRLVTEIPGVTQ